MDNITKKKRLNKLNSLLNIVMGSSIGVFIGHGLFNYSHYQKNQDFYALQSAPWYTSTLIYGSVMVSLILIAIILKIYIRKKEAGEE